MIRVESSAGTIVIDFTEPLDVLLHDLNEFQNLSQLFRPQLYTYLIDKLTALIIDLDGPETKAFIKVREFCFIQRNICYMIARAYREADVWYRVSLGELRNSLEARSAEAMSRRKLDQIYALIGGSKDFWQNNITAQYN